MLAAMTRPALLGIRGRLVRELRALDLPLDEVRRLLDGADRDEVSSILVHHRERLTERAAVLSRQLADLERPARRPQRQPRRPLPGLMRGPQ
jgi:DNA-binding transcriptional MerR regulator